MPWNTVMPAFTAQQQNSSNETITFAFPAGMGGIALLPAVQKAPLF
jgi:hypothetical protein